MSVNKNENNSIQEWHTWLNIFQWMSIPRVYLLSDESYAIRNIRRYLTLPMSTTITAQSLNAKIVSVCSVVTGNDLFIIAKPIKGNSNANASIQLNATRGNEIVSTIIDVRVECSA